MTNGQVPGLENWEDFMGKFLKHAMVKTWPALFVPISVRGEFDNENNAHLVYTGDFLGKKKDFEPNVTNKDLIRKACPTGPKALIGKKVYFKEVMNFNPSIGKKVPSLEIEKIE